MSLPRSSTDVRCARGSLQWILPFVRIVETIYGLPKARVVENKEQGLRRRQKEEKTVKVRKERRTRRIKRRIRKGKTTGRNRKPVKSMVGMVKAKILFRRSKMVRLVGNPITRGVIKRRKPKKKKRRRRKKNIPS